ncbi:MAG: FtsX-like permease family protein [Bacteroidota bacterium]
MFQHLSIALKSTFRNFKKNWQYGSLNILGLATAFATLILVTTYLFQETTYESFHEKADRIYRPTYHFSNTSGYDVHFARVPSDYINLLPDYFSEIEALVRFQNKEQRYIRVSDQRFKPQNAYITDKEIFDVFTLPLISGNPKTALAAPHSVVLTETMAKKYFSTTDIIGRTLQVTGDYSEAETTYQVTGVMRDLPANTHLPIDVLFSFANEEERSGWAYVYTLLKEGATIESVEAKMPDFITENIQLQDGVKVSHDLQALTDIHLTSNLAREIKPNGQAFYINIFFWVGLFVWLIAIINFANLSSALAMSRGKEMGVRKVLGASQRNLLISTFAESIIFSFAALTIGTLMTIAIFPFFRQLTGVVLFPPLPYFAIFLAGMAILSGLLAGVLPAMVASSIEILQIIKQGNNWSMKRSARGVNVKRGMVTLQFCATIILMGSALVAYQQFAFIQHKNLSLQSEQIVTISEIPEKVTTNYLAFKNRLKAISGVRDVSACMQMPSSEIRDAGPVRIQGKTSEGQEVPMMDMQIVDPDFVEMMGLELVAGENFTTSHVLQLPPTYTEELTPQRYLSETPRKYLINETAMRQLGWNDPSEAIGQQINWSIGNFELAYGPVTGVLKDYHQESLRNEIDPLVLTVEPIWLSNILIKVETANLENTLAEVEAIWNEQFPYALEYSFLDELFNQLYQQDRVQLQLLSSLALIAILLSFIGLISLIAYALKTRSKELAIRRVVGANLTNLTFLVGKEYLWVLSLAATAGIPISYYWVSKWLQNFAYHIDISPFVYAGAFLAVLGLLVGTIYLQTFRATVENPISALREE